VLWDDSAPGEFEAVAEPSALQSEYRFCPQWDPLTRDYRPGEQLKFARMKRVLREFGL
jgi:hypothetical protein